jgi:hypothetical protein
MITQWLNSIGLVFGMAGVVLLFVRGPPQPTFEERVSRGSPQRFSKTEQRQLT